MSTHKPAPATEVPSGSWGSEDAALIPIFEYEDHSGLTLLDKIKLLHRLFIGREDVYAKRWENHNKGTSGYAPDCLNEWDRTVCRKPEVKCGRCKFSEFMPVRNSILAHHLQGRATVGTYVLLKDETCKYVAADFDKRTWRKDVQAFVKVCRDLGIPVLVEVSRSGQGAHVWILFETPVPAITARKLGTALITRTCATLRQLSLESYDRLFPAQDRMPKGGMGNLIAVPLQGIPKMDGHSVFVDENLRPHKDQWLLLANAKTVSMFDLEVLIADLVGPEDPLDVAFLNHEAKQKLLKSPKPLKIDGPLPSHINITMGAGLRFENAEINESLRHRLIRLSCFQNKKYWVNQRQGLSVKKERRVLSEYKLKKEHLTIPRGCLEAVEQILTLNGVGRTIVDERQPGTPLSLIFHGELYQEQQAAMDDLLVFDDGVLCAPPAFGKTVVASAMIVKRAVSTLVVVETTMLLDQWRDRLSRFLGVDVENIGTLVGGKNKLTGIIDVACQGSLAGQKDLPGLLAKYGQIMIDECHHSAADSYKDWLVHAAPKFIFGMTAEDERSDGHQPYVFMRCGPIRHIGKKAANAPKDLQAIIRYRERPIPLADDIPTADMYQWLLDDEQRTQDIITDVLDNYGQGRKCLILTERVEHVKAFARLLKGKAALFVLTSDGKGAESKKSIVAALAQLPLGQPHVLVATYKLLGEAFDHAPLDTLFIGAPFTWKGRLRQYAGRLDRFCIGKKDVKIFDYVDQGHPMTLKMWARRRPSYRRLGYRFVGEGDTLDLFGYD